MMMARRAGSRACSWINCFAFFCFRSFFVQKNWASYEALSQQRGIEPATWHWASNEGMVNRDRWIFRCSLCSSNKSNYWLILAPYEKKKKTGSLYICIQLYTCITPNRIIMVNRKQHQFSCGRRVALSWREIGKSNFRVKAPKRWRCNG